MLGAGSGQKVRKNGAACVCVCVCALILYSLLSTSPQALEEAKVIEPRFEPGIKIVLSLLTSSNAPGFAKTGLAKILHIEYRKRRMGKDGRSKRKVRGLI